MQDQEFIFNCDIMIIKSFLTLALLLRCGTVLAGVKDDDSDFMYIRQGRHLSVEQPWFQRLQDEDTTGLLKRCFKRTEAPESGSICSTEPKICFFGNQECDGVGLSPTTKCECDAEIWTCADEPCPIADIVTDPLTCAETIAAQLDTSVCPLESPIDTGDIGNACSVEGASCSYGSEECCGECFASNLCFCSSGEWICLFTDACFFPRCGPLYELQAANFVPYPGSDTGLSPSGSVTVEFFDLFEEPDMSISYDMEGLPPNCQLCGVHVHVGITCEDASLIGGHYWNASRLEASPWTPTNGVSYTTDSDGAGSGSFNIASGYGYGSNVGHALVFHAADGSRVACGTLEPIVSPERLSVESFGPYPGSTTDSFPTGTVDIDFYVDETLRLYYDMSGLPPNCEECGVHVHVGTTCDDASLIGGHYWNPDVLSGSPWTASNGAFYSSDSDGIGSGFFNLFSGYDANANIGHAVVFHAADGSRIACGVLVMSAI